MELNDPRQSNKYDKIFKENMDANLEGIVAQVLSMKITRSEEIADDLQQTKERKPDLLKKVQDENGQVFILHIEYQRQNDQNMAYRMADYCIMLHKKYKLPVSQHMIYLGKEKLNMPTHIDTANLKFSYDAKAISTIDYKLFLYDEGIEMKLLTILADLSAVEPKVVLTELVMEIKRIAVEELAYGKYINQLKVFAQLRDLEQTLKEVMDEVENFYVKEKDPFFMGGKRENNLENARKMKELGISIHLIIQTTGLTKKEIQRLK
ncbi:hypothetical protein [Pedobacter gandavensis]|uniref:hypothetical protein n=1 Tax=Pedobacter gandavensis TaxID=2679963 RepID=UPI00293076B3|nr:hypothetical protein [Pedobacter gandavensis]